jgi:hypothetical protein
MSETFDALRRHPVRRFSYWLVVYSPIPLPEGLAARLFRYAIGSPKMRVIQAEEKQGSR